MTHPVARFVAGSSLATSALALVAGCAAERYEPRPIDARAALAAYDARRLTDPALAAFVGEDAAREGAWPPAAFGLDALVAVALHARGELRAARAEVAAAHAAVESAGARPNPTLALDPEIVPGASGAQRWVLGALLDLPLETADKRALRTAAAEATLHLAELDAAATAWRVRSEVRDARLAYDAAQVELAAAEGEAAAERALADDLRARLAGGDVASVVLAEEEARASGLSLERAAARARRDITRAELAAALGVPAESLDEVSLEPLAGPPPEPARARARDLALGARLDLARALLEHARCEAELRLEVARQHPDVHLGPGTSWDQGTHKYLLGLSLELPVFARNEGPIGEARARRTAAAARFEALQEAATGATEAARLRYAGALRTRAVAAEELDALRTLERAASARVDAGAAARGELLLARVATAQAARRNAGARVELFAALGALEDVLGVPLVDVPGAARLLDPDHPTSQP